MGVAAASRRPRLGQPARQWRGVTAQAVGTAIGSLHQRGLVTRTPDPGDRRRAILSLTDRGWSAFAVRDQIVLHRLAQALESGCTASERRRLAAATPLL